MSDPEFSTAQQEQLCMKYNVAFVPPQLWSKLGTALNVRAGLFPIHGLRHPPEGDTNGWYIWAGTKFSESPDFFTALHVEHIMDWCPIVQKFLALPPGWRFLIATDHEDVWFDQTLLNV